jgi:hypothetical protein
VCVSVCMCTWVCVCVHVHVGVRVCGACAEGATLCQHPLKCLDHITAGFSQFRLGNLLINLHLLCNDLNIRLVNLYCPQLSRPAWVIGENGGCGSVDSASKAVFVVSGL